MRSPLLVTLLWAPTATLLPMKAGLAQGAPPMPVTFPEVTLPGTQLRSLRSSITSRNYDLYISAPSPITAASDRKYPVLYLLDGQWDFKLLTSIQGGLRYDQFVPDVIIVGITYSGPRANYDSLRAVDYTPVAQASNPGSGQASKFLSFLETELIPFVETNYPADPTKRALMGSSFGGLFTLYAMFTKPTLFSGYVSGSPAVTYAKGGAFVDEAAFAATHDDLSTRLFVAVGDQEQLAGPVADFVKTLRGRNYRSLTLESRIVDGERHAGNKPEAFNRGLRFLFQPR